MRDGRIWSVDIIDRDQSTQPLIEQLSRTTIVGRFEPSEIQIDDASVSRTHVRLEPRPDRVGVTDLGSTNGTYLDGARVAEADWYPGQLLSVGEVQLALVNSAVRSQRSGGEQPSPPNRQQRARQFWARRLNNGRVRGKEYRLLWIERGAPAGQNAASLSLEPRKALLIGSHLRCDIVIGDTHVSSQHAQVTLLDGGLSVVDLKSTNGSWIEGTRVENALLLEGQQLRIGSYVFSIKARSDDSILMRAMETIIAPANRFEKTARNLKQKQKVFISYSRKDSVFADEMAALLAVKGFDITIDRRNLPYGEEWKRELAGLVRGCDTVLFLVSGASIASSWCTWEIELTQKLQKRLFPIAIEPLDPTALPHSLSRLQTLPAQGAFVVDEHLPILVKALNTDHAWVKEHSRLSSRAREWLGKGKPSSLLLRGDSLKTAVAWSKAVPGSETPSQEVLELMRVSTIAVHRRTARRVGMIAAFNVAGFVVGYIYRGEILAFIIQEKKVVVKPDDYEELKKYRSEFFGRLRASLEGREGIRIVGDRFILQTDVTFPSGQAELTPAGRSDMDKIATALKDVEAAISLDESRSARSLNWVLQIDGHTDKRPIKSQRFPSNWELSTARATSVLHHLTQNGVPPNRLVAAGHGEHQELAPGMSEESFRQNRRIELKLTSR